MRMIADNSDAGRSASQSFANTILQSDAWVYWRAVQCPTFAYQRLCMHLLSFLSRRSLRKRGNLFGPAG
jgi:hypothetical protein